MFAGLEPSIMRDLIVERLPARSPEGTVSQCENFTAMSS